MTRRETRMQVLMAVVGSFLALAVFTSALFAEDPLPVVPPGANYPNYNPDLTWDNSGGQGTVQPGTVCVQQPPCLQLNYCYTPYNATFDGTQYQSMKDTNNLNYGLCQLPLPGSNPGPDCTQFPTVACATVDLWTLQNCTGVALTKFVFRRNACLL